MRPLDASKIRMWTWISRGEKKWWTIRKQMLLLLGRLKYQRMPWTAAMAFTLKLCSMIAVESPTTEPAQKVELFAVTLLTYGRRRFMLGITDHLLAIQG
jgi:hypothetical protein